MPQCRKTPAIHIFALVLGSLEIVLFGGVIFGWHSVVYIYKDTDYFNHICRIGETSPSSADTNISWRYHHFADNKTEPLKRTNRTDVTFSARENVFDSSTKPAYAFPSNETDIKGPTDISTWSSLGNDSLPGNEEKGSIHFSQLSCEDKIRIRQEQRHVCREQDQQFNLVFSLATGINGILSFPSGVLYDRLGTRISRIISIVSFVSGQLCLIFASPSVPFLLYPGFVGLVYGGYQILLTNLQLGSLVPSIRSTIMSLYSGSYDTSSSIFLLFKVAHENGISINACFTAQCILYVLIFCSSTFLLLPATRIPYPRIPGYRLRCLLCHYVCRPRGLKERQTCTSHEWQVDKNGSVILNRKLSLEKDGDEATTKGLEFRNKNHNDNHETTFSHNHDQAESAATEQQDYNMQKSAGPDNLKEDIGGDSHPPNALLLDEENNQIDGGKNAKSGSPEFWDASDKEKNRRKKTAVDHGKSETDAEKGGGESGEGTASAERESMLKRQMSCRKKTFKQVALSAMFLTDLLWISVHRLRSWIFVGMFNPWITRLACGDKELVSHYTSIYAGLQFFGILTAPLSGQLMDRKIKGAEKYGNPRYERLHASIASFVLNSSVAVLLTVCTLIPVLQLQYVTFALHCLHRSFLYGPNSAFVANAFQSEHFGKLFGVTLTVSAVFSMLQYPLFIIMQGPLNSDPMAINIFLLVLMLASFIHPIYIWRYLQKKLAKRRNEATGS